MILLVDNYDSFVYNLARYCERLGQATQVVRSDAVDLTAIRRWKPDAIIISPGPCTPTEAGGSLELVRRLHAEIPLLGVCLGHQVIGAAFGGRVVRASEPMHGRASAVIHQGESVFEGLPNPLNACRYHSLVVERESLPECLKVTATTRDGTIMGLAHRDFPVVGVQFHPESILTDSGYPLISNFLRMSGLVLPADPPQMSSELREPAPVEVVLPLLPVTF